MDVHRLKPAFGAKVPPARIGDLARLQAHIRQHEAAVSKRIGFRVRAVVKRAQSVTLGRTMPIPARVAIGSGRQMRIAVVFLDVVGFSKWPNATPQEQQNTLALLNLFLGEMLSILRACGGEFEKNTGDGLMGYFGTEAGSDGRSVRSAAEAAVTMHMINDQVISPVLQQAGIARISFRVGMDFGPVTISKIGIHGLNSLTAVGKAANTACHIMEHAPDGGIVISDAACGLLPTTYLDYCEFIPGSTDGDSLAWRLDYRRLCSA